MAGSIDIMISGWQLKQYEKEHAGETFMPPNMLRYGNSYIRELIKIFGLYEYFDNEQKTKYDQGYGDIGVVNIWDLISTPHEIACMLESLPSDTTKENRRTFYEFFHFMREHEIYHIEIM